jgi:hypothetical protein|nr:MAG TPA: hypothetical protein [Caudoviricetes sp.]DAY23895.1 MAG TPA: hypothetical protein [Caudoviricetes sp.]
MEITVEDITLDGDNERIIMNTADKVINDLAIQFANKTIECANYKALYEEAQAKLEETQEQLFKVNKVLQSDEKLKELFDEIAEKLEKE